MLDELTPKTIAALSGVGGAVAAVSLLAGAAIRSPETVACPSILAASALAGVLGYALTRLVMGRVARQTAATD